MNNKHKYFEAVVGWGTPQLQIQITPLRWGFGLCFSKARIGLNIGPFAFVLWYRLPPKESFEFSYDERGMK